MTHSLDLLVIGDASGSAAIMEAGAARLGLRVATTAYDVPAELLRSARHVHVASFYSMPELAAGLALLFKKARSYKATTSLDPNDDPSGKWDRVVLDPVLRVTDILFLSKAEAHALTGHPVPEDAAGILARRGPLVVVRDGAAGAFAHDGSTMVKGVDTVVAGDSFDAGYLTAVLNGFNRERALAIAGTAAVESAG